MTRTGTVERRDFLRGAVVLAGTAYAGVAAVGRAQAAANAQSWQLDTSWGYPKGAHGRTSCHCHACVTHAANKIFSSESAALAGTAHAGCLCVPFSVPMDPATYDALFTGLSTDVVDRRDPVVQDILDPAPVGTFDTFSPDRGQVGHAVILTGTQFTGATRVVFGHRSAPFTVDSNTQITATVPDGARTGPILVRMPGGTFSSVSHYIVKHRRKVTLAIAGDQFYGQVSVVDGLNECRRGVPVIVERLHGTAWNAVARTRTRPDGSYSLPALKAPGQYRAVAPWARLASNDFCMVAISRSMSK